MDKVIDIINKTWENRELLKNEEVRKVILDVIYKLDEGVLRVAEKVGEEWKVNEWIKKAILLYFPIQTSKKINAGDIEFFDKIPLKKDFEAKGVRAVTIGIARYGSYLAPGVIMMPSYVNIGAYVD